MYDGEKLTPMQHRFAIEYLRLGGEKGAGKAAAIAAGYAPGSAAKTAYDLLQLPKVKRIVQKEQQDSLDRVRVEADWIKDRLKEEAEAEGNSGGERIRALELLAKMAGMFVERKEVTHNINSNFFASIDMSEPIEADYRIVSPMLEDQRDPMRDDREDWESVPEMCVGPVRSPSPAQNGSTDR